MRQATITGIVVPVAMLVVTLVCKFLARRGNIRRDDFAMGLDASLVALTSAMIHVCDVFFSLLRAAKIEDVAQRELAHEDAVWALGRGGVLCVILFFVMLVLLVVYARCGELPESPTDEEKAKFERQWPWVFLGIGNAIGLLALFCVLYVLRNCPCLD